jgi:MFS family permease
LNPQDSQIFGIPLIRGKENHRHGRDNDPSIARFTRAGLPGGVCQYPALYHRLFRADAFSPALPWALAVALVAGGIAAGAAYYEQSLVETINERYYKNGLAVGLIGSVPIIGAMIYWLRPNLPPEIAQDWPAPFWITLLPILVFFLLRGGAIIYWQRFWRRKRERAEGEGNEPPD